MTVGQSCGIRCDEAKGFMPHPAFFEVRAVCKYGFFEREDKGGPPLECLTGCGEISNVLPTDYAVAKCGSEQAVGVTGTKCQLKCSDKYVTLLLLGFFCYFRLLYTKYRGNRHVVRVFSVQCSVKSPRGG